MSAAHRLSLGTVAAAALAVPLVLVAASPAAAQTVATPGARITVLVRGNGHGHGMSQYGAQGAAIAGKSYRQIAAFYYPHTAVKKLAPTWVRVQLSGAGTTTTVAAYSHLTVRGVKGVLPTRGVARYRLVADSGSGLTLQSLSTAKGASWRTYRTHLANGAYFHRTTAWSNRLFRADGTSTRYYGTLAAYRTSGGVYSVNKVSLDRYAAGVTPREMPASWRTQAVDAQALAARTYGYYAVRHPQSSHYDLCDTTSCQVYGGHVHYGSSGQVLWSDFTPAASATSYQVLTYGGSVIFAQFSASSGGWATSGGQPYLPSHADTYDTARSGDPYLGYRVTQTSSSFARYFGLKSVSKITITKRDGHGAWGGRVTAGTVTGKTSAGKAATRSATGFDFQYALGIGSTWFTVVAAK